MRPATRTALALAATLALALPLTGAAVADPGQPLPSQEQVDQAQQQVTSRAQGVAGIQAELDAANARLESANVAAEMAAEAYNGAVWRLSQARKETRVAEARSAKANRQVEAQRIAIVTLVTESYQNGTELNTATAMMSSEGPVGMMNRYAVVSSAGDSMEARHELFRVASARAKAYVGEAERARAKQEQLTTDARAMRDQAGAAAASAGSAAAEIASHKQVLVRALAKAQNISVALATERQQGLEELAQQRAAAAAAAKSAAAEAAQQAAQGATQKPATQKQATQKPKPTPKPAPKPAETPQDQGGNTTPPPAADPAPPVDNNPPPSSSGVDRAIAYARAQVGKPYRWGASGPSSFDCSGLTMMAWRQGGKSLPHYSVAQLDAGTRIPVSSAKAGDLLFWSSNGRPSGIHHVALSLGGGQFIEAPRTGVPVRYNSVSSWYPDFAVRL